MFNILGNHFVNEDSKLIDDSILDRGGDLLYAQLDLQKYILLCCQNKDTGGLRDKPGVFVFSLSYSVFSLYSCFFPP